MKALILDKRTENASTCYLVKINLADYINNLPNQYQDYDIQREIVSNVYLDKLVDTVLNRGHIPPIVLVIDNNDFQIIENQYLKIKNFKILDGLQRTFRLESIGKTIDFWLKNKELYSNDVNVSKFQFSKKFSSLMREISSNTDVLRSVINKCVDKGNQSLEDALSQNGQWFEVWVNLSPEEEIKKMLTLNAGHKPVKARHQLELLFLNLLPYLKQKNDLGFTIVREKEIGSTQFSKNRKPGDFHFAHLISALLSYYEGKPIATTASLIQGIQTNENILENYSFFITPDFLGYFIKFLINLDNLIVKNYGELGVTWLGREVTMAGLFGALGSFAKDRTTKMEELLNIIEKKPTMLDLQGFELVRNNQDLSKVNIGNVNRNAIYSGIRQLLKDDAPPSKLNWQLLFEGNEV